MLSAALYKQDVVPNIDGTGFVVLGVHTSKMTKAQMSELLDLIVAFGTNHGVSWSDPTEPPVESYFELQARTKT